MQSNLTSEQLRVLLATANYHSRRDWLMILVAFTHGLRASEVVGLTGASVRHGMLHVKRLKRSLRTTQPLFTAKNELFNEAPALSELARKVGPNQRLFPICRQQFWRIFRRHAIDAGIPRRLAHPHTMKHTLAMQMIGSAGIENTRQYLGHKSMASTGAYLKVSDADASAAAASALARL